MKHRANQQVGLLSDDADARSFNIRRVKEEGIEHGAESLEGNFAAVVGCAAARLGYADCRSVRLHACV
jgi:hypothetical protein